MRFFAALLLCFLGLTVACDRPPASQFEETSRFVDFTGARPGGEGVRATVEFESIHEAIAPFRLKRPLVVEAKARVTQAVALPVPFSTRGVWARVTTPSPAWLVRSGARVLVGEATLVHFPVNQKALTVEVERDTQVTIEPLATIDTAGGGFEAKTEEPLTVMMAGTQSQRLSEPAGAETDDTFARLVLLEVSAVEKQSKVQIGRCAGSTDEPSTEEASIEVPAHSTVRTTRWLSEGSLCLTALSSATVRLTGLGRVRRFATSSLRPVRPVELLDTESGVGGWKGKAAEGQRLEVSLAGLREPGSVSHRLITLSAEGEAPPGATVALGPCGGGEPTKLSPGASLLMPKVERLCLLTSGGFDVHLSLSAVVTERSQSPGQCGARPSATACTATDLLGKLNCIPGVSAVPTSDPGAPAGSRQFLLTITQPVDHFRPEGETFGQRALLTVRNEAAALVLHTTGYELFHYFSDISAHFATNELELEHRFFEDSTPAGSPLDYSTLNIMQSAWDSHRVVELLSPLFTGPWLNTGHSKGGMTALYHRRFFPCDVVATAPYVTPLSLGKQDQRYGPWLAQIGGPAYSRCRQVAEELERGIIGGKARFASRLAGTYTRIRSRENALYALTGTALWGLFQRGRQADPTQGCPAYEPLLGHPNFPTYVEQYSQYAEGYSDESLSQSELDGYSYQTQNELGSPGVHRAHLLEFGPIPELPDDGALIFGNVKLPPFEARAMPDVQRWLSAEGEHFFFLYGGFDPWSAGQVDVGGARDTAKYMVPGASHGVSIKDMPEPEREQAYRRIEGWLGVQRLPGGGRNVRGERLRQYRDVMHRHHL